MPTQLPYKYGASQEEDQDPYRRETNGAIVEPYQDDQPVQEPKAPTATEPSQREPAERPVSAPQAPTAPAPTFKQMQDAGQARPPMPATMMLQHQMGGGPQNVAPETGLPAGKVGAFPPAIVEPEVQFPGIVEPQSLPPSFPPPTLPPAIIEPNVPMPGVEVGGQLPPEAIIEGEEQFPGVVPPELPVIEPSRVEDMPVVGGGDEDGQGIDAIIEPPEVDLPFVGGEEAAPESSVDLLSMLLGGVQDDSELFGATEQAALDQINNPSPYNADVVKDLYSDLGAGIDADYDSRIRGLDEGMARRGLYGSVGKDFHSGRMADTELGRRDAKTSMARDLAQNYATSYGDYSANAISQGSNVAGQDDASTLQWLHSLLGYGQQGFENDMDVAQFDAEQNAEYQQLLQMMLAAGYGA